ncbi:2Fe-2S iron-sulfur cluster-binding protein [Mycolicibacterium parafortuitum]|uniref:Oxidoreductase FAD-binding subunit [Frankia sp. EAN1pec] n=1 Tax=Mycolicibacterium parafortuitum TaxID=39692 RepID=A0A375YQF4_MYCPF|nr:2Fe-2S iron-sulfur cluster-binding protein [Mycolicibacterium parafortuitum]ORB28274.1 (2Fe-2S)-binding protein [Mycolicibacterium parafortuitum]SRX83259.1 oxidoreductase FAD-binding subunit [Frankia sp. EAN1pec] [Mycolicibacterium parafortuitum]
MTDPQTPGTGSAVTETAVQGTITIQLDGNAATVANRPGETLLESARRAGMGPPFSCEAGNCGTCMALLTTGTATMRVNDALTEDEVAEGYVLTCQAVPDTPDVTVNYDE